MRCLRHLSLVAALLCAFLPEAFADQVVYFVNGKAIMVKSVEKGEKFTVLEMEGGGRIGVPTDQISRIEDYVVTAPAPVVVAPVQPPVAAMPAAVPSQAPAQAAAVPVVATGQQPQQQPMAPGPGVGGRPAGAPGQNIANLPPLEIGAGAGASNAGPQRTFQRPGGRRGGGPAMVGSGAVPPNMAQAGRRPGGRGSYGVGRGARRLEDMNRGTPPAGGQGGTATDAKAAPAPNQVDTTTTTPDESAEPPPAPDDPNEQPSDPPAPEEGDESGNTPGGPS